MKDDSRLIENVFRKFLPISLLYYTVTCIQPVLDTMIAGKLLGSYALQALVVAASFVFMTMLIISSVMVGGRIRSAWHIGRSDERGLNGVFSFCILFLIIAGAILFLCGLFFSSWLTKIFGAENQVFDASRQYIRIVCMGSLPSFISTSLMVFSILMGKLKNCFTGTLLIVSTDVFMDVFLIKVCGLGMQGLAMATVIGYTAGSVYYITVIRKTPLRFHIGLIDRSEIGMIFKLGMPFTVGSTGIFVRSVIFNHFVGALGIPAMLIGMSLQNSMNGWLSAPTAGSAETISTMTGMFYGERDREAMRKTMLTGLKSGCVCALLMSLATFILAPVLVMAYGVTSGASAIAVTSVRTYCIKIMAGILMWVFGMYYETVGRVRLSFTINILEPFIFPVLLLSPMVAVFGPGGFWYVYLVSDLLCLALMFIVIAVRNKKIPRSIDDYMLLDDVLPQNGSRIFDTYIMSSGEKLDRLLMQVYKFCTKYGVDEERKNRIINFVRNSTEKIISESREKGYEGKSFYINTRIMIDGDRIMCRLRNNGPEYNPLRDVNDNNIEYYYKLKINVMVLHLQKEGDILQEAV